MTPTPAPDAGGPEQLVRSVVAALQPLPAVRAIALFGSLAEGRGDRWSDVDMLVACDRVEATCWEAAAAIRAAKPVLYYRVFTAAEQPSGRYWFAEESPFHKLDVSFHTLEDHLSCYRDCARLGHDVVLKEVYRSVMSSGAHEGVAEPTGAAAAIPLCIDDREMEIGKWIRRLQDALKGRMRGTAPNEAVASAECGLRTALAGVPSDAVMAGGQIGRLARTLLELAGGARGGG
jgi:predicted nucleotidyltransferase